MIHLVASGPSVLTTWNNSLPQPGDIVCAISGAARYVDNDKLDWWAAADRHLTYSPLLDPPTPPCPKIGYLTDRPSYLCLRGCGKRVEIHDHLWPLDMKRRFTAPCAAVWLLENHDGPMMCYGVDLAGKVYAWANGPEVDTPTGLAERWAIERRAWAAIDAKYPGRVLGLPETLMKVKV